ncbi:MAG: hypothetical protein OXC08_16400 [Thiotrichales bacterium]|nr:hypothetical protein [Thiotrichales bacterium]
MKIRYPHSYMPYDVEIGKSRENWEAHQWTPPGFAPDQGFDPEADPKPTWEQLVRGYRLYKIQDATSRTGEGEVSGKVDKLANAPVRHRHAVASVDVGGGIDHMTAMLHHAQEATAAGRKWPVAVMRDTTGELLAMHTVTEAGELLGPTAAQKNRASSAGNMVRADLEKLRAVALDPNGRLPESTPEEVKLAAREVASAKYQAMLKDLTPHFETALNRVDRLNEIAAASIPDTYPLARLKAILVADLESVATAKIKDILNAAEQQGMDLAGSCRDQSDALEAVSRLKQQHQILIERADDHADAKSKFAAAEKAIKAIRVERTPQWYGNRGALIEDEHSSTAESVFIQARSPVDDKVSVAVRVLGIDDATPPNPHASARTAKSGDNMNIFLGIIEGDAAAKFELRARNVCGPSTLIVTVNAPEEE